MQSRPKLRNVVILPADNGQVIVVMDKKDYQDKINELVSEKWTYQEMKPDPMPALHRQINKLLTLNKLNAIDTPRY